jgi:regulator of sigma E protease
MVASGILFLIVLSLLVLVHELGHFLTAKKAGVLVEEFGLGYPPRIFGIKWGETIYSLNLIPFGGFVKLFGQEIQDKKGLSKSKQKRAFFTQSRKTKTIVLLGGVIGNFLLAIVCFTFLYAKVGIPTPLNHIKILDAVDKGPAYQAGLRQGDNILAVEGERVETLSKFSSIIEDKKGEKASLQTQTGEFEVLVRESPPEGEGSLGVVITDSENKFYTWWKMPFLSIWAGIKEAFAWTAMITGGLVLMIKQLFSGITPEVAGPIGIYQLTSMAASEGFLELVQFVGILSINLAVLNLIPFPALDGGHLAFLYLGSFLSEKKKQQAEQWLVLIGFVFLISLMILITINDLKRIFDFASIFKRIKNFLPF